MRRLRACCLALFALFALGAVTAATASAELEPVEVHIVLGEAAPATAEGELKGEKIVAVETELGAGITYTSWSLKLEIPTTLASLGKYTETFLGAKRGTKECWTAKPGKDEHIVVEGEWHLRNVGDPKLLLGIDFLLPLVGGKPQLIILCGKPGALKNEFKIELQGSMLGLVEVENMKQVTEFKGNLKCTKPGVQEVLSYLDKSDKEVKLDLLADLGLGAELACLNVKTPFTLKSNKMLEFLF